MGGLEEYASVYLLSSYDVQVEMFAFLRLK